MRSFLKYISYIFHPIFIPIMATIGYFQITPRFYNKNIPFDASIAVMIFTICIPLLLFLIFRRLHIVDSIFLKNVKERKVPLYTYVLILFIVITKVITKPVFPELHNFFLASLVSALLCLFLVVFKIKASIHMMGIAGLTLFMIALSILYEKNITFAISVLILLIGIIGSSRLFLKAHTFLELIIGFVIGSIPQLIFAFDWLEYIK